MSKKTFQLISGIVSYYHCMNRGRGYEITDPEKDERETTYKKYWHG